MYTSLGVFKGYSEYERIVISHALQRKWHFSALKKRSTSVLDCCLVIEGVT